MEEPDSEAVDRRRRQIYDLIGNNDIKRALHETEKMLKKTPNNRCGLLFKGWIWIRMGRVEEGHAIINKIFAEKPCHFQTCRYLSIFYLYVIDYPKVSKLYENAVEKDPNNEKFLRQFYLACVLNNDFARMPNAAMRLFKVKPTNASYCWAVMGYMLKATRGCDKDDPIKRKLSLQLAQRMMEKLISDKNIRQKSEAQLYLMILDYQGKYTEQLEFLDTEIGKKIHPGAHIELRIRLMHRAGRWPELNLLLKKLVRQDQEENIDQWELYQKYIETVLELVKSKSQPGTDEKPAIDTSFESCNAFLSERIKASNMKNREPYLARLKLYRVMIEYKFDARKLFGEFMEMLIDYFRIFGGTPSCAKDIGLFLNDLQEEQRQEFASKLIELCNISVTSLPKTKEQLQRHICSLQVSRMCGVHALSADNLIALYTAFTLDYEHRLATFGIDILPKDTTPSETYALFAVHAMYDLALTQKTSKHLVEALCLSFYLLSNNPDNFHAKLLCIQLFHRIGCGMGAQTLYDEMDFQVPQLDTMGYLHGARLPSTCLFETARSFCEPTLSFFMECYTEGSDLIQKAYEDEEYSKIQDLMDVFKHFQFSSHFAIVTLDAFILELVLVDTELKSPDYVLKALKLFEIDSDHDIVDIDKLCDNRDLNFIGRRDPDHDEINKHNQKQSFQQEIQMVKIRCHLFHLINIFIRTIREESFENFIQDTEYKMRKNKKLAERLKSWTDVFEECRNAQHSIVTNEYLVSLLPSRLHGHLDMPYESVFTNLGKLFLSLQLQINEPIEHICQTLEQELAKTSKIICDTIETYNKETDLLWNRRVVQETISNCIEILALVVFVMIYAHKNYQASLVFQRTHYKNKKKTKEMPESYFYKQRLDIFSALLNRLKTEFNIIDAALETWKMPDLPKSLDDTLAFLPLNTTIEKLITSSITENHETTINQIRSILKKKLYSLNRLSKASKSHQ